MRREPTAVVRASYPVEVVEEDGTTSTLILSTWFVGPTITATKARCPHAGATFETLADPDARTRAADPEDPLFPRRHRGKRQFFTG